MMGKGQKILTTVLWAITVVLMLALVGTGFWANRERQRVAHAEANTGSASHGREELPVLFQAPSFSLVDQDSKTFSSDALAGNVWIADFIFTHCAGPCPKMSGMMADMQNRIERADVKLVTFTVDPERDSPAVLRDYADRFGADHVRWKFLTGSVDEIAEVARGMNIAAQQSPDDRSSITHSTFFLLVDRVGSVRGVYRQSDSSDLDRLVADASALAEESAAREKSK